MNLLEYRNKLYHSSYELKYKAPLGVHYEKSIKIKRKQNEDFNKCQFIRKLLLAKESIK